MRYITTLHMLQHLPRHHFMFRGGECRADEATGLITIRIKSGQYSVMSVIQVPDGYPMEGCGVQLKSHNFPERIARHHVVQVPRLAVTLAKIVNKYPSQHWRMRGVDWSKGFADLLQFHPVFPQSRTRCLSTGGAR